MADATRRTHVVRVYDKSSGEKDENTFIDVEVLDAIAFKIGRGEEVVLNLPAKKAVPHITDDTGNGLAKDPADPTRRSHVELIKGDDPDSDQLLIEVIDAIAFRDKRGEEWILKMPSDARKKFNTTTHKGDSEASARTHNEKISVDPTDDSPKDGYLTVERTDAVAFKSVRGKEMVLKMESHDTKGGKRASTHIWSPEGYDPTNDDIVPPENTDPHFYVKFVKDKGIQLGDTEVSQGMLWWIRKISGGSWIEVSVSIHHKNNATSFDLKDVTNDTAIVTNWEFTTVPKKMPFDTSKGAGSKPSDLDLKKDLILRGNSNDPPSGDGESGGGDINTDYTSLVFINCTKAGEHEVDLTFPKMTKGSGGTIGYFIWAFAESPGTGNYIPIHPAPTTAEEAAGPYPFDDTWIYTGPTWIGLWNSYWNFGNHTFDPFPSYGIPVPPAPDQGAAGWSTAAGAQTAVDAFAAYFAATQTAGGANYPIFSVISIPFGKSSKVQSKTVTVTARHYVGRLNFPYDGSNSLQFDDPKKEADKQVLSFTQNEGEPERVAKIKLSAVGALTVD